MSCHAAYRGLVVVASLVPVLLVAGCGTGGERQAPRASVSAPPPPVPKTPALPRLSIDELLKGRSDGWRVAQFQGNPALLIIEFPNLAEQGEAMNRIAALLEKAGAPRDRVLEDRELRQFIEKVGDNAQTFFFGHDYDGPELERFFQLADQQGVRLTPQERRLRQILLDTGLLPVVKGKAGAHALQALISFTGLQPDDPRTVLDEGVDNRRRNAVLRHELSHGEFLTNTSYRERCWRFWRERLNNRERQMLRHYLLNLGYDGYDEDLLVNEVQALLFHTPDERAFGARALGISNEKLEEMRQKF